MKWTIKSFEELTADELYQILKIRVEIFVVEQECPYPEIDGMDKAAEHLYAVEDNEVKAYARLLPPGTMYQEASIGRVLVAGDKRGTGLGKELMKRAVKNLDENYSQTPIRLQAQEYAEAFYAAFSFQRISDTYLEDNIPHVDMRRNSIFGDEFKN
ncbi:GNAT family N-acetyltransferase [Alkalicoccus halolimnae]|uniref:GNAT family N-acetyltransferase n=1 Tax=Alkalicoccus halolimnae TaxID=1667239 RepID=A0A5C7F6P5_9BACI|nr:GNAT family N-acetyltransferase [Alkalicoccus halolimnae]TXF85068.1 GNAT family N-acetyltransferase [Alkalicoccus halolimnae]